MTEVDDAFLERCEAAAWAAALRTAYAEGRRAGLEQADTLWGRPLEEYRELIQELTERVDAPHRPLIEAIDCHVDIHRGHWGEHDRRIGIERDIDLCGVVS